MKEELIKQIENEFRNHIATLTEFNGIQVVRWAKPNTNNYSMNVIYQGHYIYISGDLGEAVYDCTWKTNYKNCSDNDFGYLTGKLACIRGNKKNFDPNVCSKDLDEWYKEMMDEAEYYDEQYINKIKTFYEEADRYTDSEYDWIPFLRDADEDIVDFESSLFEAGFELNNRLYCYWVALRMICEYLEGDNKDEFN